MTEQLAEEHRIPREPEHKIHMPSMGNHLDDFWGREMTIATDEDMGQGPLAPESGQEAVQDHRILRRRRPLPRAQEGGHQSVRGAFKNQQWQIAITLVVMVIEGELLLAMGRVFCMIEVQDNRSGRLRIAGDEVVDERLRETVEVRAGHLMFEPGEGRRTRQVLGGIERDAFDTQLKHGIVPETVRIIAVRIAGGDLIDTLGEEVPEWMVNIRWVTLVTHGRGQALCQADLTVDTPEQEGAEVGRQRPTVKIGPDRVPDMGGNLSCSGGECGISKPLGVFTE